MSMKTHRWITKKNRCREGTMCPRVSADFNCLSVFASVSACVHVCLCGGGGGGCHWCVLCDLQEGRCRRCKFVGHEPLLSGGYRKQFPRRNPLSTGTLPSEI